MTVVSTAPLSSVPGWPVAFRGTAAVLRGLPRPEAQYPVQDVRRRRAVWLDLAYPEQRIGIEYEGADHVRPSACCRMPAGTRGWSTTAGRMYRFTKHQVYREPDEVAGTIERALGVR